MARTPRGTSTKRAKEIADRYFDLDSSTERGPEDDASGIDDDAGLSPTPRRTRPKTPPPPPEPPLTNKQHRFIEEYCVDFNGTQAAIRAGYSERSAAVQAHENLRKPNIAKAIDAKLLELERRAAWDAVRVLRRLGEEVTADIADIFTDAGGLKPVKDWPMIWRQGLVAGIKSHDMYDADGDVVGIAHEIKLSDRLKRLELIGRHVAVGAWREQKKTDPVTGTLAELRQQLTGTALRPKEIEGTARPVDGV